MFVVLDSVIQLPLGEAIERDMHSASDPGFRIAKHVFCRPGVERSRLKCVSAALRLFGPHAGILFRREVFETVEQPASQMSSGFRPKLQHRRFEFLNAHA